LYFIMEQHRLDPDAEKILYENPWDFV
jgi:hypothetical protein